MLTISLIAKYWRPLILTGIMFVLFVGYGHWRYSVADDAWQQRWTERDLADAEALARQQATARAEEQRLQQAINQVTRDAQQQITAARADAATAADSVSRLQRTIKALQRRSSTSSNTSASSPGKAGRPASDMLANVLGESLERSRALAAEADRRRIAGLACEQSYDAVVNHAE